MRVKIYSDLHLEFKREPLPYEANQGEELVILADDISTGTQGVSWAMKTFPHVPVVYVLGNHEFYSHNFEALVGECKALAHGSNVHVLENDAVEIGDVRVLGCTLWTNFCICGQEAQQDCMRWAQQYMSDFLAIRDSGSALRPGKTVEWFRSSVKWLSNQISTAKKPLIVVTPDGHPKCASRGHLNLYQR